MDKLKFSPTFGANVLRVDREKNNQECVIAVDSSGLREMNPTMTKVVQAYSFNNIQSYSQNLTRFSFSMKKTVSNGMGEKVVFLTRYGREISHLLKYYAQMSSSSYQDKSGVILGTKPKVDRKASLFRSPSEKFDLKESKFSVKALSLLGTTSQESILRTALMNSGASESDIESVLRSDAPMM